MSKGYKGPKKTLLRKPPLLQPSADVMRKHATNTLKENIERKDTLFSELTRLYINKREKFNKIKRRLLVRLKKEKSEEMCAAAGYIYYLEEDFNKSTKYFLKTVALKPDNLDNWMDSAFSLRHQGESTVSSVILFHFDHVIHYYKNLTIAENDLKGLKKLLLLIHAHVN